MLDDWTAAKTRKAAAIAITIRSIEEFTAVCGEVAAESLTRRHAAEYHAALVAKGLKGRSIRNLVSPLVAHCSIWLWTQGS